MTEFDAKIIDAYEVGNNKMNQKWWENNPMIYDWDKDFGETNNSKEYLTNIDNLFGDTHSLINNPDWPKGYILEKFIPYAELAEKKVLEIGCGCGLVASHIAKAGADLTAIDLTDKAIEITKKRFEFENLTGNILQMDAEKLNFPDEHFDYIISWGVIHHSGNMKKIIDEIYRVLKPKGKAYLMIYNKNSIRYKIYAFLWLGIFKGKLLKHTFPEVVGLITDGYFARHLNEQEFIEMTENKYHSFKFSYSEQNNVILGYAFSHLKKIFNLVPSIKKRLEKYLAKKWGWFMQIELQK
jgi:2-polyprenyl-3-methyl-5-hydroxy-6-metoxy-1,4-benzoquinol methylase